MAAVRTEEKNDWQLVVRGLSKYYGIRPALRGVDLRVRRGEFMSLFGPNGAGKTTLLRILATLSRPSAGTAHIGGWDLRTHGPRVRGEIGLVAHELLLYGTLSVVENLHFFGHLYRVPDLEARAEELMEQVGLEHRRHDLVRTLSRGMQQRLSIARALLHQPSLLLLDEPYAGLDPQAAEQLREVLRSLSTRNSVTALMATHDLERGLELCQRYAILVQGRIVYQGNRSEVGVPELRQLYQRWVGEKG